MKQVTYGIRELQANLGDAIRAAQRGDQVLVTSRGKIVATLHGAHGKLPRESAVRRKLRRLAAEGKVRLGKPGPIPPYTLPPGITGLTEQLLADRR